MFIDIHPTVSLIAPYKLFPFNEIVIKYACKNSIRPSKSSIVGIATCNKNLWYQLRVWGQEIIHHKSFYLLERCTIVYRVTIGFVTWPSFCTSSYFYKGGQVTKPIIVVITPCKLLYVILVAKMIFIEQFVDLSWNQRFMLHVCSYTHNVASTWPCTFFTPRAFLFSI